MTRIFAIGSYKSWDYDAYSRDFDVTFLKNAGEIAELPEAERKGVRAVGYKGHASFDASVMDLLPDLGLIANYGVGFDAIDIEAANARGITVTNTPDVLNDDVADLAVAMLLAQSRRIVQGSDWVRSGAWGREGEMPLNRKVSGATVGICGLGRIGREIADRLAAFKMEIHYHSRSEKETPGWTYHADPVSLARAVDYYVVALVGGPETEGYVSKEVLEAIGPDGVIVNISRGTTVDEDAMLDALEDGRLGGAALDVFRNEPKIDPRFAALPLDVAHLQPHQASGTEATRQAMGQLQRDNIAAFLKGAALKTPVN